jgi:hypothetical protein
MTLRIVYRSSQSPGKNRPSFFEHRLGLLSFLRALAAYEGECHVTFLNDGPIPDDRLELMQGMGELFPLTGIGNSPSYRQGLAYLERTAADDDLVYMVEDDYLHREEALNVLAAAARELPDVDYFSLYAGPPDYHGRDDQDRRPRTFTAPAGTWRTVESMTMTFAARMGTLRQDSWIHWLGTQKPFPDDRRIWHVTQGLGPHRLLSAAAGVDIPARDGLVLRHLVKGLLAGRERRRRLLVARVEPLATHAEAGVLAPGVDWEEVARSTSEWDAARDPARPR